MKNALKLRRLLLMLADAACFACVTAFASALQRQSALQALLLFACLAAARLAFAVYRDVLRYAGTGEYLRLILADFVGGCVFLALRHALFDEWIRLSVDRRAPLPLAQGYGAPRARGHCGRGARGRPALERTGAGGAGALSAVLLYR